MSASNCQTDLAADVGMAALDTPALVIDAAAFGANLAAMTGLLAGKRQRLRPHAKTHKSALIARRQIAAGAVGICCAKLSEAEVLAAEGIDDILITTPIVDAQKLNRLARLSRKAKVAVVLDDTGAIEPLAHAASLGENTLDVFVEVDVGQHRCGVPPGPAAAALVREIARHRHLNFKGLQGYQGAMQSIVGYDERRAAAALALDRLQQSAELVRKDGYVPLLTGGGSGSLAIDLELDGLDELQPGSFVFMDASYAKIEWRDGGPPPFRTALSVLAGVVSRPAADRAIVDVGWKSASCDSGPPVPRRSDLVFQFAGDEHGSISRRDGGPLDLRPGDKIELVPSHCDTTVNLYSCFAVVRDGRLETSWPVTARGNST